MPKNDIDYSKIIIYKIIHKEDYDNKNIYIGSTTNFVNRKNRHKNCYNNPNDKKYHLKMYENIRENGGWEMWNMIEIEKYPCFDKNESLKREREWIEYYKSKLNIILPTRTDKEYGIEYYQKNKEKINEYHNQYRDHNKEKLIEYEKIRNKTKIKCDKCGCEVVRLDRHKKSKKCNNFQ